jgi:hypothetical protein
MWNEMNPDSSGSIITLIAPKQIARHEILCDVNCDIILTSDFCRGIEGVRLAHTQFLMVGRRWDIEIKELIEIHKSWLG